LQEVYVLAMYQLFFDTATKRAVIGLAIRDEILEVKQLPMALQNSKFLVPALLELLEKYKLSCGQLGLISCGVGPGSYTGIRIGAALAQSMAYALRIPLIGFSSLEGFVPQESGRPYAAILDARYAGVYLQKGEFDGITPRTEEPEAVALPDLSSKLSGISLLVTPDAEKLQMRLEALEGKIWEERFPSGEVIARRCYQRFIRGEAVTGANLDLLYLRKTQAERNFLTSSGISEERNV
jgi:tRNA threonylcarbamoyl adenosine modification protein YeaZ